MAYIIYTVEKIEKEIDITALLIFSNHIKKLDLSGPGVFKPPLPSLVVRPLKKTYSSEERKKIRGSTTKGRIAPYRLGQRFIFF